VSPQKPRRTQSWESAKGKKGGLELQESAWTENNPSLSVVSTTKAQVVKPKPGQPSLCQNREPQLQKVVKGRVGHPGEKGYGGETRKRVRVWEKTKKTGQEVKLTKEGQAIGDALYPQAGGDRVKTGGGEKARGLNRKGQGGLG